MGTWRVVVLMRKIIYEVLGMAPGTMQVLPQVQWRFRAKGPEPGPMSPLPAKAGDLGLVGGWMR